MRNPLKRLLRKKLKHSPSSPTKSNKQKNSVTPVSNAAAASRNDFSNNSQASASHTGSVISFASPKSFSSDNRKRSISPFKRRSNDNKLHYSPHNQSSSISNSKVQLHAAQHQDLLGRRDDNDLLGRRPSAPISPSNTGIVPSPRRYSSPEQPPPKSSTTRKKSLGLQISLSKSKSTDSSHSSPGSHTSKGNVRRSGGSGSTKSKQRKGHNMVVRPPTNGKSRSNLDQYLNNLHHPTKNTSMCMGYDPDVDRIAKAAIALDNAGNELFERGDYDRAMATYIRALKLKNRTLLTVVKKEEEAEQEQRMLQKVVSPLASPASVDSPSENAIVQVASKVSDDQSQTDHTDDFSIASSKQSCDIWGSVATSINNIGYLRQQAGVATTEETMAAYENSLHIKRAVFGKDNLSVGKTLNNLGTVHYLKRDYEPALKAYMEAYQIMYTSLGKDHLDVGTVHSNIADVHYAQGQFTEALKHYREAFEVRWKHLGEHDPKTSRLLEKIASIEVEQSIKKSFDDESDSENYDDDDNDDKNDTAADDLVGKKKKSPKKSHGGKKKNDLDTSEFDENGQVRFTSVSRDLENLHAELGHDITSMDIMEKRMISDMVKDRLKILRDFRLLQKMELSDVMTDDSELGKSLGDSSNRHQALLGNRSGRSRARGHRTHNNTLASQSLHDHIVTIEQHEDAKERLLAVDSSNHPSAAISTKNQDLLGKGGGGAIQQKESDWKTTNNSRPTSPEIPIMGEIAVAPTDPVEIGRSCSSPPPTLITGLEAPHSPTLSPVEREEALNSLKHRLTRVREARANNISVITTIPEMKSLQNQPQPQDDELDEDNLDTMKMKNLKEKVEEQRLQHYHHKPYQHIHVINSQLPDQDDDRIYNYSDQHSFFDLDTSLRDSSWRDTSLRETNRSLRTQKLRAGIDALRSLPKNTPSTNSDATDTTAASTGTVTHNNQHSSAYDLDSSLRESNREKRKSRLKAGIDALRNLHHHHHFDNRKYI